MAQVRISMICKYHIAFTHIAKYEFLCVNSDMSQNVSTDNMGVDDTVMNI